VQSLVRATARDEEHDGTVALEPAHGPGEPHGAGDRAIRAEGGRQCGTATRDGDVETASPCGFDERSSEGVGDGDHLCERDELLAARQGGDRAPAAPEAARDRDGRLRGVHALRDERRERSA
jgi:hypothetical protein